MLKRYRAFIKMQNFGFTTNAISRVRAHVTLQSFHLLTIIRVYVLTMLLIMRVTISVARVSLDTQMQVKSLLLNGKTDFSRQVREAGGGGGDS